jgi:hypothetical protein
MFGRVTALQIASASLASFFCDFTTASQLHKLRRHQSNPVAQTAERPQYPAQSSLRSLLSSWSVLLVASLPTHLYEAGPSHWVMWTMTEVMSRSSASAIKANLPSQTLSGDSGGRQD